MHLIWVVIINLDKIAAIDVILNIEKGKPQRKCQKFLIGTAEKKIIFS